MALIVVLATACLPPLARTLPPTSTTPGEATVSNQQTQTANAPRPTATPKPTAQPTTCPPMQEKVGDQWIWYPTINCLKGISYSIAATSARIVDLRVEDPKASATDFKLARLVANFEVRDSQNKLVETFSPAMRLYLAYTSQDVANAKTPDKLAFAFVNEKNAWVKFSQAKHGFTILRSKQESFPPIFEFLDSNGKWKSVSLEVTTYSFNSNKIPKIEVDYVYNRLKAFPDFAGFAFVQVSSWADRLIAVGT